MQGVGLFSDLNLNGPSPLRAQPGRGVWGPSQVPSTRVKKWQRALTPIVVVAIGVAVFFLARMFFLAMTGA
ncbi:MAG: hypothetical protein CSA64_03070 [Arachnia propionica]|nr:MAG: hypothetical protein CSA64_03070 [Arachnia propionica]